MTRFVPHGGLNFDSAPTTEPQMMDATAEMAMALGEIALRHNMKPAELFGAGIAAVILIAGAVAKPGHIGPLLNTGADMLRTAAARTLQTGSTMQ